MCFQPSVLACWMMLGTVCVRRDAASGYLFLVSRRAGGSAKVKTMISSPVTVLIS